MDTLTIVCYEQEALLKKCSLVGLKYMQGLLVTLPKELQKEFDNEHLHSLIIPDLRFYNPLQVLYFVVGLAKQESLRHDKDHVVVFVDEYTYDCLMEVVARFAQYPAERPLKLQAYYPATGRISFAEKNTEDDVPLYFLSADMRANGCLDTVLNPLTQSDYRFLYQSSN
jgi:hypothetical protein